MVLVGLAAPTVTNTLPSMIARLRTSCVMPHGRRPTTSRSSPMRAVPSRWLLVRIGTPSIVCGAGFDERLGGALDAPGDGPTGVVAEPVGHLRGGDPGRRRPASPRARRGCRGRGRSSHSTTQRAPRPKRSRMCSWCRAPSAGAAAQPERDRERAAGGCEAPPGAAEEPAIGIGAAELAATGSGRRSGPGSSAGRRRSTRRPSRPGAPSAGGRPVPTSSPARRARRRAQRAAAGARCRCRSPRRARRRHPGSARARRRRASVAPRARTAAVDLDPPHARAGHQLRAGGECSRPVRDVGRALRALVAPRAARPALHARVAAVVLGRQDRVVLRPPVPPESRVGAREREPGPSDRQRRERWIDAGRVRRVAAESGDAELPVGLLVVRERARRTTAASRRRCRGRCGCGSPTGGGAATPRCRARCRRRRR